MSTLATFDGSTLSENDAALGTEPTSYRSPRVATRIVQVLLLSTAAVDALGVVLYTVGAMGVLGTIGEVVVLVHVIAAAGATFVSMIALSGLTYVVHRNAATLDDLRTPTSSVLAALSWWIPGVNLYWPFSALSSAWSSSAIRHPADVPPGPTRAFDAFWFTWVASIVLLRVIGARGENLVGWGDVLGMAIGSLSALLGAWVFGRLARVQDETARHVRCV